MALKNKIALVTGGSKGIGFGIAHTLLEQGVKVAITSRDKERAKAAELTLSSSYPGRVLGICSDVRSMESELECVSNIVKTWGGLDILIANAGVGHFDSIENLTTEQWNETIDINLTGVFNSVKACVPELKKTKGYIFTIASLAGTNFFAKGAAYNASKFGLVGFTQAIMLDLRFDGIKVTTIMPGSVSSYSPDRVNQNPCEESMDFSPAY